MRYKVYEDILMVAQFEDPKDLLHYLLEAVKYELKIHDTKRNVIMTITDDVVKALKEIMDDKDEAIRREEEFKASLKYHI